MVLYANRLIYIDNRNYFEGHIHHSFGWLDIEKNRSCFCLRCFIIDGRREEKVRDRTIRSQDIVTMIVTQSLQTASVLLHIPD